MMGSLRWLVVAAALAQAIVPRAPTNLKIGDGGGVCPGGQIGAPPDCFPAPPAPVASGKEWRSGQFDGSASAIESGPIQLILHMMIDNQWERDWGSVLSSQTLVRQLEVDYIRIYQQQ